MIKPRTLEVNAFHRSIGGHDNALASRHLQYGGIVTDALGCFSPLVEKYADDVEFTTGAEFDIVTVIAVFHLATLGSTASTGGSHGGSGSFHARGKAYSTSSSVVPRT